jgi:hypothetical protein
LSPRSLRLRQLDQFEADLPLGPHPSICSSVSPGLASVVIGLINQTFGKTREQEKQPWLVCAAWMIRAGLQKNFTSRP